MTSDQISQIAFAESFGQLPDAIARAESLVQEKQAGILPVGRKIEFTAGKNVMADHLDL